jgi:hypothetical protein
MGERCSLRGGAVAYVYAIGGFSMRKFATRSAVAGIALTIGLTGVAQAQSFNIWSASQTDAKVENVRHRHHHHHHDINPGLAVVGAIGAIAAGAAIANSYDDDDYYYRDRRYYYDDDDRYYGPCNIPNRPAHYPAPPGC